MRRIRDTIGLVLDLLKWPILLFLMTSFLLSRSMDALTSFSFDSITPDLLHRFGPTIVVTSLLLFVLFRNRLNFWDTFHHESVHAVVALFFFNRVVGFRVTDVHGGLTEYVGRSNWIIRLAPYFLPLVAGCVLVMAEIVESGYQAPFQHAGVVFYIIFLRGVYRQARPIQSDLQHSGILFSYGVIVLFNLMGIELMIAALSGTMSQRVMIYSDGIEQSLVLIQQITPALMQDVMIL
ncbi:MAG: M50 family metallopeptidase [Magnetococcales bacterium]|nr:M50 family metallopeptidase [Magnetococcales bacterium]